MIALQERMLTDDKAGDRPDLHEMYHLSKSLRKNLEKTGWNEMPVQDREALIQWLYFNLDRMKEWTVETLDTDLNALLRQEDTRRMLKTNYYDRICWFNKEAGEMLADLIRVSGYYMDVFAMEGSAAGQIENALLFSAAAELLEERIKGSEYRFDRLITADPETEEPEPEV